MAVQARAVFLALILGGLSAGAATPKVKCPVKFGAADMIDQAIKAVSSQKHCHAASAMASACAMGSSADLQITGPAFKRCEAEAKLSAAQKKALEATYKKCDKKNAHQGTMYMSMNAFCHLEALESYVK